MSKLYVDEIHPKTAGGSVTIPNVPTDSSYFYAVRDAGHVTSTNTIVFNLIVSNEGNDYDNTNGIYTAPVSGLYWFSNTFLHHSTASNDVEIRVDNSTVLGKHRSFTAENHNSSSWSGVTYLNAGQDVRCVCTNGSVYGIGTTPWTNFTGYLIR
jgi:hypothetical protein